MSLRSHLLRGVFGSLGLTIFTAGLTFMNGVLLARLLGAASYGIYASAIAIVLLLSVPLTLGFDRLLIRDVASSESRNAWSDARGLIRRSVEFVLPISIATIVDCRDWRTAARWVAGRRDAAHPVVGTTDGAAARDHDAAQIHHPGHPTHHEQPAARCPDRPGLFCLLLAAAYLTVGSMSAAGAMALNLVSVTIAFTAGLYLLYRQLPHPLRTAQPTFATRRWVREALPFALSTAALTLMNQVDVILVGSIAGAAPAGLYAVAARGAGLALFGAIAVNTTLAPTASQLWSQNERGRLQFVVTRAARGAFLFALGVAVVLWIFGPQFLLLFGPEFVAANSTLAVLAFAQVIDCGFGIGSLMLSMTGYQSLAFASVAVAVVLRIALDIALIPGLGPMGAAIAAVVSITIFNGFTAWFAARRLRLDATPLGLWHPQLESSRILATGLGRIEQTPGGSARYMSGLNDALRAAGHDVLELTGADVVERAAHGPGMAGQVARTALRLSLGVPRGTLAVGRFNPDLVTVHFALDGLGATLAAGWTNVPVVSHFHGPWASEAVATGRRGTWPLSTQARHGLEQFVYRRSQRFVTLSDSFAGLLSSDYGVPSSDIRTIPGGIDISSVPSPASLDQAACRDELGIPERPTFVTVRRLVPRTAVDLAIAALAVLRRQHPGLDAQLLVAGTGPEMKSLRALAHAEGVGDRVIFIGQFPDEWLWLVHGAADACVVPSRALEGFGYGALEGLAAGRPTVVTNVGGLPELVAPINPGWVVEPSAAALATALADILTNPERQPTSAALRRYAEGFDWRSIAERVADVYREAISDRSRPAT